MNWLWQIDETLWLTWSYLTSGRTFAIVLGIGFALLAITLFIASRTKWGQAKPLTKCVVLSILAHVWLLMYALGNRSTLPQGDPNGRVQDVSVAFVQDVDQWQDVASGESQANDNPQQPWETPVPLSDLPIPELLEDNPPELNIPDLLTFEPTPLPTLPPPEELVDADTQATASAESLAYDSSPSLETVEETVAEMQPVLPDFQANDPSPISSEGVTSPILPSETPRMTPVSSDVSPVLPVHEQLPQDPLVPREYTLRQAPNRLQLSAAYGADADSEAAVAAGLQWLADAQSADGSWVAAHFGAGTDTRALGETRGRTGQRADTGVSGLALLAFLSAGHTHLDGEFRQTVGQGLRFLLDSQMPSGDLSGPKQVGGDTTVLNARMYCHGIATLALAEAYAMTHDAAIQPALMRAAQYTINAQDVRGGGWRYRPREPGDLSQFGWQAMALKSVQRSGIEIPVTVQQGMRRFLDSCSAGSAGGLATYRPPPLNGHPSETMTAEALACRLMLDYPLSARAHLEATSMIMAHLPGEDPDNVYYWYYATIAMFQLQDANWRSWNQAMKQRLLETQIPSYREHAGSWNPDSLWGGYGGRVYSTAMCCLCLEVYYRYLPMYQQSNVARAPTNVFTK
ncbi:MAG: terpene cyclase/mutase family protein [Planctomycetales bacterium]|nr:terpene cyclase/mutase family protein [Planctomycetales bacterium]